MIAIQISYINYIQCVCGPVWRLVCSQIFRNECHFRAANLGPVIRSIFFYCFIQIYTLQNMKQRYGVLLAHLIYSGTYGQNY